MTKLDSEFTCEVVKVTEVMSHPNADRLDVVRFSFVDGTIPEYQVVVSRGDFKCGDLGVYISDDSMVPIARPEFSFLTTRLDYKKGNAHYRVRAAKIRGVVSTGMMVVPDGKLVLGDDWSDVLGVVRYYTESEPAVIETGTERRTGSVLSRWWKKFLNSSEINIPDYSVISLRKCPTLFDPDELVCVTEKIHGSNIRFGKVNGRLLIGSHHVIKSDHRPWWKRLLKKHRPTGSWYGNDVFTEWFKREFPSPMYHDELPNNIVFYGELYGSGIQKLNYSTSVPKVVVFDAWNVKEKRWLNYNELICYVPSHISLVPTVAVTRITSDTLRELSSGASLLDPKSIREGVVVRSADWKKCGKWVGDEYLAMKGR